MFFIVTGEGSNHTRNAAVNKDVSNVAVSQFLKESSIGVHIELFLEVNAELRKDLRDYSLFAWATLDISRDGRLVQVPAWQHQDLEADG